MQRCSACNAPIRAEAADYDPDAVYCLRCAPKAGAAEEKEARKLEKAAQEAAEDGPKPGAPTVDVRQQRQREADAANAAEAKRRIATEDLMVREEGRERPKSGQQDERRT